MHDDLSVKENLTFIAGLRLPAKLRNAARQAVVADVMAVLEIERIGHSVIGNVETRGISGGQRKRVNIGMEMVGDPSLLFLDEPTSGLGGADISTFRSPQHSLFSQPDHLRPQIHPPRTRSWMR